MTLIAIAALLVVLVGPATLGAVGVLRGRRSAPSRTSPPAPWDWRLIARSALLNALAFNLVFFLQELFLVLPKALVPGLRPTLFHNNHRWEGDDPLAALFQGTGALATLATALICLALLAWRPPRASTPRLFLIWMIFHGFFKSLPQVVVGALNPKNDVGVAMAYLGLTPAAKTAAALIALAAIVAAALWLTRRLLSLAPSPRLIDSPGRRTGFIFQAATLPGLIGVLLVLPFRVPGHPIEVLIVPLAVAIIGLGWIQACAWRSSPASPPPDQGAATIWLPLLLLGLQLAVFQLVLARGVAFF